MSTPSATNTAARTRVEEWLVEELLLDVDNPRLPKFSATPSQDELTSYIAKEYAIAELMDSFVINGYFDEEPLVAIPNQSEGPKPLIVVEGNRRLVALKLLLEPGLANRLRDPTSGRPMRVSVPKIGRAKQDQLRAIPVRIYETRAEILPYLGYRHITGVMTWDSYPKARYVAQLVQQGMDIRSIQRKIGDRHHTARRLYRAYLVWEQAEQLEMLPGRNGHSPPFSYLFTALTYVPVLTFLGMKAQGTPRPVPERRVSNLGHLTTYLYGNKRSGRAPAIRESREIKLLAQAVASQASRDRLNGGALVQDAVDAAPPEDAQLEKLINQGIDRLTRAFELAPRHRSNAALRTLSQECLDVATQLNREFRGS